MSNLKDLLQMARRCIDPGAMPEPEYVSLCKCTLKAIDAALSAVDQSRESAQAIELKLIARALAAQPKGAS